MAPPILGAKGPVMRSGLRLGCALMAMLLPLACLTRATGLSLARAIPAEILLALGVSVIASVALGAALLLHGGWPRVAACLVSAAVGFGLGTLVGDPFLMAVPLAAAPMALATLALDPRDEPAGT